MASDALEAAGFLTPPEQANLLAAQAVAAVTSFIDRRSDASDLARAAARIYDEVCSIRPDPRANDIVDVIRMLVIAMVNAAICAPPRAQRWADIMGAFVPLLRQESTELAASGAQRQ